MKNFFITLVLFFILESASANTTIQTINVLKTCSNDYIEVFDEMKQNLVSSSPWNYDNDYDKSQVLISEGFDFTNSSFKVNVFFDIEGLRELGYIYEVKPVFFDNGACSYINTHYEEM